MWLHIHCLDWHVQIPRVLVVITHCLMPVLHFYHHLILHEKENECDRQLQIMRIRMSSQVNISNLAMIVGPT